MEIHQLEYLVAVAEEAHFSRAAERVGVAQPSLSQQIKKLEQEIGQPLFDRMARGVVLTEAGRVMLEHARRVLGEIADARKHVSETAGSVGGTLVVGAIPTIAPFLLPDVLTRFSKQWPAVKLRIFEGPTSQMVRQSASAGCSPIRIQPRSGSTGPPRHNGSALAPTIAGSRRTMLLAGLSVGRFNTSPNAPSGA